MNIKGEILALAILTRTNFVNMTEKEREDTIKSWKLAAEALEKSLEIKKQKDKNNKEK